MEKFDYGKAMAMLDKIAVKVEDPSTGIDDIDKYVKQAEELVTKCREYLRGVREKTESI